MDGEEKIFDPAHPIWKIILILVVGLLALGGVGGSDLLAGVVT